MDSYVYHGSPERNFEIVTPKQNRRFRYVDGELTKVFDQLSFHATQHRWIALTYMYDHDQTFEHNGTTYLYNKGVDLYEHKKELEVYGIGSVEESLKKLYGKGGYLYTFDASDFFHTDGLGNLELITQKSVKPVSIEFIQDPVAEMAKDAFSFTFFDIADPKNEKYFHPPQQKRV